MFDFLSSHSSNFYDSALEKLLSDLEGQADLERREVRSGRAAGTLLWLDGLVDAAALSEEILRPFSAMDSRSPGECLRRALTGDVWRCPVRRRGDVGDLERDVFSGFAVLLLRGAEAALSFELRSPIGRDVSVPMVEKSVLGAKDSFTETLRVNTALVRRRLPSPRLRLRELTVGREAPVRVCLFYWEGAAPEAVIREVTARLEGLALPALTDLGALERALAGRPRGLLPQALHTERPDRFARELLRGKAGLLADGFPLGLVTPASVPEMMRSQEDASRHALAAAALLALRWTALFLALLLPAVYTAAALYHPEMIPRKLLVSVIRAKARVPFSTAAEVLGMLFSFELLQEAGIRLPEPVGQTVSVIGALIVGQSAVEAQVLSPIVIIVVAVAGIAGYTLPSQELGTAVRIWRAGLVIAGAALGLYGVMCGVTVLLWRLCATENLGVCCLDPLCGAPRRGRLRALWKRLAGKREGP